MQYTKQPLTSRVLSSSSQPPVRAQQHRVLLVEDDAALQQQLQYVLADCDIQLSLVGSLREAQDFISIHAPDILILDRGLPDGDGLEILKNLDATVLPCVVLTAQSQLNERIRGLRMGAVEYVPKPFSREEFKLKVQRLLEVRFGKQQLGIGAGAAIFYPSSGQIVVHNQSIQLPRREAQVLTVLLRHSGQVLTKMQIIQLIWQHMADQPNDETIEVYVRRLRKRLPLVVRDQLQTVRGYGYRFSGKGINQV